MRKQQERLLAWLLHQVCTTDDASSTSKATNSRADLHAASGGLASSKRFFARFGGALNVEGKSVLDVGCGGGQTCVEAALRGATSVLGVDIRQSVIDEASAALTTNYPDLALRIRFARSDGTMGGLGEERFDVVLSKDSFEHYAEPERSLTAMATFVKPGGVIAIGFAPLWKSPRGGHIDYMTKLPWAHLIFPEHLIMAERRRFRPQEQATRFEDVSGGLNKMTLARFCRIVRASAMQMTYFRTNVSDNPVVQVMKIASRVPPVREFMTTSVYAILQPVAEPAAMSNQELQFEPVARWAR